MAAHSLEPQCTIISNGFQNYGLWRVTFTWFAIPGMLRHLASKWDGMGLLGALRKSGMPPTTRGLS